MTDPAHLTDIKSFAADLSPWAHIATVGADDTPDVSPVHPCWDDDTCWVMVGTGSVKARNIAHNPAVALHWQVSEVGDGVELWGTATLATDVETKRRMWDGVFDYDLSAFSPGGPDGSPETGFLAITPERAIILRQYGMGGISRWKRDDPRS